MPVTGNIAAQFSFGDNKVLNSASFAIEVESATDSKGAKMKTSVTPKNIFDVAEAIKGVLSANTPDCYVIESSKLTTLQ